jgi:hypothetical protein
MKSVAGRNGRRNISDKSLECPALSKNTEKNIAAIDLCETAGWKLDISVRS